MMSYGQLFLTLLPVFALIVLGAGLRHAQWISEPAEASLFNLVVKVTFPCLIFESVAANQALHEPGNLLLPPLLGFGLTLLSMATGWYVARALGLTIGHGLRTFALAVGLANYGYLPLPLMDAMFGPDSRAVLLVHNVGVEAAIWTAGILVVSGAAPGAGWRRLVNAPIIALVAGLAANLSGAMPHVPGVALSVVHALGLCAIPLGLLIFGATVVAYFDRPRELLHPRTTPSACLLRLAVLPVAFLLVAKFAPLPLELKRVLVVQAAMPSGMMPLVLARHYGGQPVIAAQIIIGTTVLGVLVIPLWLRLGLAWAGG